MEVLWDLTRAVSVEHWGERLIGVNLRENGRRGNGNQKCELKELCLKRGRESGRGEARGQGKLFKRVEGGDYRSDILEGIGSRGFEWKDFH